MDLPELLRFTGREISDYYHAKSVLLHTPQPPDIVVVHNRFVNRNLSDVLLQCSAPHSFVLFDPRDYRPVRLLVPVFHNSVIPAPLLDRSSLYELFSGDWSFLRDHDMIDAVLEEYNSGVREKEVYKKVG